MTKIDIKKSTVFKCEVCGGYHSEEESEIIVIKVVKGKNCELRRNISFGEEIRTIVEPREKRIEIDFPNSRPIIEFTETKKEVEKIDEPLMVDIEKPYDPADPKVVKLLTPEERQRELRERKSQLPQYLRNFGNMNIAPGDAEFDTKGAKLTRKI